jgi:CHRD domain-containing protein
MMYLQKQSTTTTTRLTLSLIIALAMLCAAAVVALSTVKSTQAQLEHFARPIAATTTATGGGSSSSTSSSHKELSAKLTGSKEVPPVNTDATGTIRLAANSRQDALDYQLSLSNLNGVVIGAHIHRGSAGTNGPVVADLNVGGAFASASAGGGGGSAATSTSSGGTITSADLKGPLAGKHVSDLIKIIEDGKAYANVHTKQHPNGEIRGQLTSSSSSSSDIVNGLSASSGGPSATASATSP